MAPLVVPCSCFIMIMAFVYVAALLYMQCVFHKETTGAHHLLTHHLVTHHLVMLDHAAPGGA